MYARIMHGRPVCDVAESEHYPLLQYVRTSEWTHCLFISLKHTSAVPSLVVAVAVTPSSSAQGQSSRDIAEVDVTVPTFDVDDEDVPEVRFVGGKYSHLGQMMSYLLYLQ